MAPREWSERFLASTRGRIVLALRRGPAAVETLAGALGLSPNGIRVHLATLERDGWIRGATVPHRSGPGKPATEYRLVDDAEAMLSTAYQPLLLALLSALAEREPPARIRALLTEAGRRLAGEMGVGEGSLATRAVRALESLGAMADVERVARNRVTVRGVACPLGKAVSVEPGVCRSVCTLLAEVLDAEVAEHCDRAAGQPPRCRFEIAPRGRAGGGVTRDGGVGKPPTR